ncbi:TetR/AcrR family transcriptional regulator [Skermania piniformis]
MLAAALSQAMEHGVANLSIKDIAARAGVAETTIYRRWGHRTAVVADAVTELAGRGNPPPDTGTLRGDLVQLLEQTRDLVTQPGMERFLGTTIALFADPDIAAARRTFWNDRLDRIAPVIRRGIDRGELRRGSEPHDVIETLCAPLYFRLFVTDKAIDARFVARCVEHTFAVYADRTGAG